jgi:hypothetical protein
MQHDLSSELPVISAWLPRDGPESYLARARLETRNRFQRGAKLSLVIGLPTAAVALSDLIYNFKLRAPNSRLVEIVFTTAEFLHPATENSA